MKAKYALPLALALWAIPPADPVAAQSTPPQAPIKPTEAEARMLCLVATDSLNEAKRMTAAIRAAMEEDVEPSIDKLFAMLVAVRIEIAKTETFEARCGAKP